MITREGVIALARYNLWQNQSVVTAADSLSDEERQADKGAFFKSIHGTLSHILWGDKTWMARFAGTAKPEVGIPESAAYFPNWEDFCCDRAAFDQVILDWAQTSLSDEWLTGELSWFSGAAGRDITAPKSLLVLHMFNHQTHHRGQVNALLTAAGANPDDTDLMLLAVR